MDAILQIICMQQEEQDVLTHHNVSITGTKRHAFEIVLKYPERKTQDTFEFCQIRWSTEAKGVPNITQLWALLQPHQQLPNPYHALPDWSSLDVLAPGWLLSHFSDKETTQRHTKWCKYKWIALRWDTTIGHTGNTAPHGFTFHPWAENWDPKQTLQGYWFENSGLSLSGKLERAWD